MYDTPVNRAKKSLTFAEALAMASNCACPEPSSGELTVKSRQKYFHSVDLEASDMLPAEVDKELQQSLCPEEIEQAQACCGIDCSEPSDAPQALFIIGPSAAGKSTIAAMKAREYGLNCPWEPTKRNYVEIDGDQFRLAHHGFAAVRELTHGTGKVWRHAGKKVKDDVNEQKRRLFQMAANTRCNILVADTCTPGSFADAPKMVSLMQDLVTKGYSCHVVLVYGDKWDIIQRGRMRALSSGKWYQKSEFENALAAAEPLLRTCNGNFSVIVNTGPEQGTVISSGLGPVTDETLRSARHSLIQAKSGVHRVGSSVGKAAVNSSFEEQEQEALQERGGVALEEQLSDGRSPLASTKVFMSLAVLATAVGATAVTMTKKHRCSTVCAAAFTTVASVYMARILRPSEARILGPSEEIVMPAGVHMQTTTACDNGSTSLGTFPTLLLDQSSSLKIEEGSK